MINELTLLSGNDIPFTAAGVTIHPPTIKEIGYIGEEAFFTGCELINFSKDILDDKDKIRLEHLTNFEVLMSIMNDNNIALRKQKNCFLLVLTLLFPNYQIHLNVDNIELAVVDENDFLVERAYLTKENYEEFKKVIKEIFCLSKGSSDDYNPAGDLSRKIAEKLKERQRILAKQKGEKQGKIAIFSRYISILAVGQQKDINSLMLNSDINLVQVHINEAFHLNIVNFQDI